MEVKEECEVGVEVLEGLGEGEIFDPLLNIIFN